jgi:DNA invertase Pin-like site-specific DNA recombinase
MTKISAEHLSRMACIYIRQSTADQVQNNLESQRRQYALAERARAMGWKDITVIDDDLGISGSGTRRPGFERLLRALCEGVVGAVFSIEASRLARNGRDWHTLLEFCSIVGALLIDADGVYNPAEINDRLLLGMKGTISEMELATFRQRAHAALAQKALRGELFRRVPIGYVRTSNDRIEKDPDERIRASIDLLFRKFTELASVRQLYFWLCHQQIKVPVIGGTGSPTPIMWKTPRYHSLLSLLRNPLYAGAYAYGQSKTTIRIEDGRKRSVRSKRPRQEDWMVLIQDHHEGYISWAEYQSNQALIANNANGKGAMVRGSVKRGGALLSGLLRCGHCGAKLLAQYPGPTVIRYQCSAYILNREASCCVMFGGLRADRLVAEQVLQSIQPMGVQAALHAIENLEDSRDERLHQKELALEHARYEVSRAQRQYNAVDCTNRLVAAELERRWNEALKAQKQLEEELAALTRQQQKPLSQAAKEEILGLANDLPQLWNHPNSPPEIKKRILRTVLKEIIARSEGDSIQLILHWQGGDHTELRFQKVRTGQHRYATSVETLDLIRSLARIQPDGMIASILNRMGRRTAHHQTWNARRVCAVRNNHGIAVYREGERQDRGELTTSETAAILGINPATVLRIIHDGHLPAKQACVNAPWILRKEDVATYLEGRRSSKAPQTYDSNQLVLEMQ